MSKITKQQLQSYLWESANILRGKIDSGDFKHYILGLLFYKRLSDVFDEEFEKLKDQVGEELALDKSLYADVFFIPNGCHWNDILSTSTNIGAKINDVWQKSGKSLAKSTNFISYFIKILNKGLLL